VWKSINATVDPGLRVQLLDGRPNWFTCGNCGTQTYVEFSLLYHDMDRKIMIWSTAGGEPSDLELAAAERLMNQDGSYSLRVVGDTNDLIDKIRVLEDGWNDRVIEVMKVLLSQEAKAGDRVMYNGVSTDENSAQVSFVILEEAEGSRHLDVAWDEEVQVLYDQFEEQVQGEEGNQGWMRIDREYALGVLSPAEGSDDAMPAVRMQTDDAPMPIEIQLASICWELVTSDATWRAFGYRGRPKCGSALMWLQRPSERRRQEFLFRELTLISLAEILTDLRKRIAPDDLVVILAAILELIIVGPHSDNRMWRVFGFRTASDAAEHFRARLLAYDDAGTAGLSGGPCFLKAAMEEGVVGHREAVAWCEPGSGGTNWILALAWVRGVVAEYMAALENSLNALSFEPSFRPQTEFRRVATAILHGSR
jgi:hypothetical protein